MIILLSFIAKKYTRGDICMNVGKSERDREYVFLLYVNVCVRKSAFQDRTDNTFKRV